MVARNAMPVTWVSQSGMDVRRRRKGPGITLPLPRRTPLAAAGAKGKRGGIASCWYAPANLTSPFGQVDGVLQYIKDYGNGSYVHITPPKRGRERAPVLAVRMHRGTAIVGGNGNSRK